MSLESGRDERTAIILAGGHSTRFGEADKAVANLAGTPMIRRVVDRLDPVVDEIVVNCRDEQVTAIRSVLEGDRGSRSRSTRSPTAGQWRAS